MNTVSTIIGWCMNNPGLVATYLGAGGGLSVLLEVLLTRWHVNSKKLAFTLLHVFTGLSALTTWYLGASGTDTVSTYAALTILAQFWHRFAVSPFNVKYVTPFLQWLSTQKTTSNVYGGAQATTGEAKPFVLDQVTPGK